jgi:hypothetical protein
MKGVFTINIVKKYMSLLLAVLILFGSTGFNLAAATSDGNSV